MKKLFDDELSLSELKAMVKRLRKKESCSYILIGALGIILLLVVIAVVVMKLHGGCCCCDDDYDDYDDDDDFDDDDVTDRDFED